MPPLLHQHLLHRHLKQQQQQQQPAREAQGVVGVDGVVEALVVSNSRLCAQVAACDARAFTESERARVLEEQLTESKARNVIQQLLLLLLLHACHLLP